MRQSSEDPVRYPRHFWGRNSPALPYHGLLIFIGQVVLVLLGFLFTAFHGVVAVSGIGTYVLQAGLEGGRGPRWVDYLWLSFSTLTTAGCRRGIREVLVAPANR